VKDWFVTEYEGVASGTEFHEFGLRQLVAILGALRTRPLETDSTLLEAWLDAAFPDWRERAADTDAGGTDVDSMRPDPYEVLNLVRAPLTANCLRWYTMSSYDRLPVQ